jgi:two-component system cell cycle sensor histidine kinase/response regulator CckA
MTPAAAPDGRAAARGTILLVEYNNTLRHMIWIALKKEGYGVLEARRADEALRLSDGHPGALVLLLTEDLPGEMTGLELAAKIRVKRPGLPLLLMTGDPAASGAAEGNAAAGDHCIAKPFRLTALAELVNGLLGEG